MYYDEYKMEYKLKFGAVVLKIPLLFHMYEITKNENIYNRNNISVRGEMLDIIINIYRIYYVSYYIYCT